MDQRPADLYPDHLTHPGLSFGNHQPVDFRSIAVGTTDDKILVNSFHQDIEVPADELLVIFQ